MRFDKFKKIYKSANKIVFSTKDDKCYIFDGFTALKFGKELKGKILENLGFAGCELDEFVILKEDGNSRIEKNEKSDVYKYFEDVEVIPAKYTGLILDGKIKGSIFDAGEGLLKFNSNYIDMAEQLTDGMDTYYDKKSKKVLFFYGEKIDVLILPARSNKEDSKYLNKNFII